MTHSAGLLGTGLEETMSQRFCLLIKKSIFINKFCFKFKAVFYIIDTDIS